MRAVSQPPPAGDDAATAARAGVVRLRRMTAADVEQVLRLEQLCFPEEPWDAAAYVQELRAGRGSLYWVLDAAPSGRPELPPLLGNAGLRLAGRTAHITTIAIHPDWRRRHLGEWLLLHLLGVARAAGARRVLLEVRAANAAAQALYRKLGFVRIARLGHYYAGEDGTADVLALNHLDSPGVWRRLRRAQESVVIDLS